MIGGAVLKSYFLLSANRDHFASLDADARLRSVYALFVVLLWSI